MLKRAQTLTLGLPTSVGVTPPNGARNWVKVLYSAIAPSSMQSWDAHSFCLWLKRLEQQRFVWPLQSDKDVIALTVDQLNYLIGGYDIYRFPPLKALKYDALI